MLRLTLAFIVPLAVVCGSSSAADLPARPNVLFIVIDNVDYQYFGKCYGGTA